MLRELFQLPYRQTEGQRAIGTSLLIIMLISATGIVTQFASGGTVPWLVTLPFLLGSVTGLFAGTALSRRLGGPLYNKSSRPPSWLSAFLWSFATCGVESCDGQWCGQYYWQPQ